MEQQEDYQDYNVRREERVTAPYAVVSLVLGLLSLVTGGLGVTLVLGIVGLVLSNKGLEAYRQAPGRYTGEEMLQVGRITSIVGVVLSSLALVLIVLAVVAALGLSGWMLANMD